MEEKKLTDEEIIKALEFKREGRNEVVYIDGIERKIIKVTDILDFINRLQSENDRLNDMKFTQEHCDLYKENEWLKAEIKRELAEHEEFTKTAKSEIERLTAFKNEAISTSLYGVGRKDGEEFAVKETAKEILGVILAREFEKGDYLTDDELHELFKERYGVEVE